MGVEWLSRGSDAYREIKTPKESPRQAYAGQAKEALKAQNSVAEIKIRGERWIGEFSRELDRDPGGRPAKNASYDGESLKTAVFKTAGIIHRERYERKAS